MTTLTQTSHPALWLDPKSSVGSVEREQLLEAGLQLLPVATLQDLKLGLARARLVVIRLMGDTGLLEEVRKLTQASAPATRAVAQQAACSSAVSAVAPASTPIQLTEEQKARIERNGQQALAIRATKV